MCFILIYSQPFNAFSFRLSRGNTFPTQSCNVYCKDFLVPLWFLEYIKIFLIYLSLSFGDREVAGPNSIFPQISSFLLRTLPLASKSPWSLLLQPLISTYLTVVFSSILLSNVRLQHFKNHLPCGLLLPSPSINVILSRFEYHGLRTFKFMSTVSFRLV